MVFKDLMISMINIYMPEKPVVRNTMARPILSSHHLTRPLSDSFAINNLTFKVLRGEIFGIVGPAKAGKTTIIKLLTGQLVATSGIISILGKPIDLWDASLHEKIGILMDSIHINSKLSIAQVLANITTEQSLDPHSILILLDSIQLEDTSQSVSSLSYSQQLGFAIICAVLQRPTLLFIDIDAFPNDTLALKKLLFVIQKLKITIILTTTSITAAASVCNTYITIAKGSIFEHNSGIQDISSTID
ncbi:ATP-binding cassette domain-containing protein [Erysipelothrix sp. HDW6C]|uniref:ATP-binding cassette domain-containing protein n=1 Tax=Erysipelothrix sp. HDW6C TaxID=2714930 RepID=UPI001F0D6B7B|nr:ATP-binding cassette domain-containing protein [Erysipelothrix sp. HDW6C]